MTRTGYVIVRPSNGPDIPEEFETDYYDDPDDARRVLDIIHRDTGTDYETWTVKWAASDGRLYGDRKDSLNAVPAPESPANHVED